MSKTLTNRQLQYLNHFLDIYQEMEQPIHYGTVAERLGIGNVTAYEMMRLLEDKGLLRSEYLSNNNRRGPGRSSIYFYPTEKAHQLFKSLARRHEDLEDWQEVKKNILQQLRDGRASGYEDLLADLLTRLPERRTPIIFITEMITAVLLMLANIQESSEFRAIIKKLHKIGLPQEIGLSVLSSIGMLLAVMERTNRRYSTILLAHINHYENALSQLNEDSRQRLGEFTRELVQILSD